MTSLRVKRSEMKKICSVVGARPNFMKMAPVIHALRERGFAQIFVHTGQHYDERMSEVFFGQLGLPRPDMYLGVGSGSHAEQTAKVMVSFSKVCESEWPDLVVVAGDVNSTLACALVAAKLGIPIAHIESGLRSFDRSMPEEINRILTDQLSELLFVTEQSGIDNLLREGIAASSIHFVGNTMIDTLRVHLPRALSLEPWKTFSLLPREYGVVTMHRPSNVDHDGTRNEIRNALEQIGAQVPLLFPVHPRTLAQSNGNWMFRSNVKTIEPLGYLEFLGLMAQAKFVITDSGGVQEETTALGVPCITVRRNTERPVTLLEGTNKLVCPKTSAIVSAVDQLATKRGNLPKFWDGNAAKRVVAIIEQWFQQRGVN